MSLAISSAFILGSEPGKFGSKLRSSLLKLVTLDSDELKAAVAGGCEGELSGMTNSESSGGEAIYIVMFRL